MSVVMEHPPATTEQPPPTPAQLAAALAWLRGRGYVVAAWETVGPDGERDLCPIDPVWLAMECAGA